ncbi:hypothetical protein JHK87_055703 [Glycine soja]|nr:hypothetical protein JHK87_055703 [Glycine soja]
MEEKICLMERSLLTQLRVVGSEFVQKYVGEALCEELTRKDATLVAENENLKRIAKSINTVVEKTPIEPVSSVAEITPSFGNGPWLLYNHFPIR